MLSGVFAAVLTPLKDDLSPDHGLFARHCRWLLDHGCDGLSVLGTTGEGNSFSVQERIEVLGRLVEAGLPAEALLPGTGCCAITDTVALTRAAVELGVAGVLMLPPFYYKDVSDDGLFAAFSEVIERIGDDRLRVYLYHIPQISGVPLGHGLIARLLHRYPGTIAGMKDSSGDFAGMVAAVRAFPGLRVFAGSDEFLLPLLENGGAGCITAVCNVASFLAAEVRAACGGGRSGAAGEAQSRLSAVREAISAYPLTAALKEILASHSGVDRWRNIRPPLTRLNGRDAAALSSVLARLAFSPPPVA